MGDDLAFVFGAVLFFGICMTVARGCDRSDGYDKRCAKTCTARGQVHSRDNGVCTCRDGTVWIWREGYTQRLGEK